MSIRLQTNVSLAPFSTFGVEATARRFVEVTTEEDLQALLAAYGQEELLMLGGGSNVLFTADVDAIVIRNRITGIVREEEPSGEKVRLTAGAGESWHALVMRSLEMDLGGLENLSLIPGTVGAAPMQNIGAYGVEQEACFWELRALDRAQHTFRTFRAADCAFGYRESVFKRALKGKFLITRVTYRLTRMEFHKCHIAYGAIADTLRAAGIEQPTPRAVSDAVIRIRQSKLPDPAVLGNAGSFFKNPVVDPEVFDRLRADFPEVPSYPAPDGVKVPAGWLIDQCGWKGRRHGQVGCYERQALVIVNHGGATGAEIWAFAQRVQASVAERFGILLEPEVNVY